NRLHIGARPAEIYRVLPRADCRCGGEWPAVETQCRVRKLRFPSAGNHFLDEKCLGRKKGASFRVPRQQRLAIVYAPGLDLRQRIEMLPRGWFDDGRKGAVE